MKNNNNNNGNKIIRTTSVKQRKGEIMLRGKQKGEMMATLFNLWWWHQVEILGVTLFFLFDWFPYLSLWGDAVRCSKWSLRWMWIAWFQSMMLCFIEMLILSGIWEQKGLMELSGSVCCTFCAFVPSLDWLAQSIALAFPKGKFSSPSIMVVTKL